MFSLTPNPTFDAAVPLSVPGLAQPLEVRFTFRHKNKEALAQWIARAKGRTDADFLDEVIESWDMHDKGEPVEYSVTALDKLLTYYSVAHGEILRAYLAELGESKKKTSRT